MVIVEREVWRLEGVREARMRRRGETEARVRATDSPREEGEMPVMRTGGGLEGEWGARGGEGVLTDFVLDTVFEDFGDFGGGGFGVEAEAGFVFLGRGRGAGGCCGQRVPVGRHGLLEGLKIEVVRMLEL